MEPRKTQGSSYDDPPKGGKPDYTSGQKRRKRLTPVAAIAIGIIIAVAIYALTR